MFNNEQKEITKTINDLFAKSNFFEILCNDSFNDINQVIENLSKIINYYLVTQDKRISYPMDILLKKANSILEVNPNILFHPSNSFYLNYYKLNGLNPYISIKNYPKLGLETLDREVSLFSTPPADYYSAIYQDVKRAIIESFSCPDILFKSILKQPQNKELPIVVGTTETNYYRSILDIRLKNIQSEYPKTYAKIGKRAINGIIGKDSLLVLLPRCTKRHTISAKDIEDNITGLFIPSIYLSFIKIPSKYKLLSICAANKQLRNGELINVNTGCEYTLPTQEHQPFTIIQYSRYEEISVTDLFEYTNSEFTGDINYDIDLIYGQLDSNKSRKTALEDVGKNIESIKQRDDIVVRKVGTKYEIRNGRHRILYLKYFYVSNYISYKKDGDLNHLQQYVTIPMNIESSIQDKIANEYLLKLNLLNIKIHFYKTNINNDNPNIIAILNNRIYSLPDTKSIIEFYTYISNSTFKNKYYIGENDPTRYQEYQKIFDYLVIFLKEKTFTMDLLDIINHLLTQGLTLKNTNYQINQLNIQAIYNSYVDFQQAIQLNRIFKTKKDLIKKTEDKYKMPQIGLTIMSIIKSNPHLIELSWDDFYQVLVTYPELSQYDEELLKDSADHAGYQKLKLEYLLLEDNEYTKTLKI